MSINTRRLYLSSIDSNIFYENFDGKFHWNLTKAQINCENNQMLAVSLVRAELPATCGISTTQSDNSGSNPNVVVLNYSLNGGAEVNMLFNVRTDAVAESVDQFPLTLQNNIQDILSFINSTNATPFLKLDDSTFALGLFRIAVENSSDSVVFNFENCTPCLLRALGLHTQQNTTINGTNPAPFNYDMGQYLPLIRLKSKNLNMNSTSSFEEGDSNILESIPTNSDNGNSYFEERSQTTASGTLIFKQKQTIIQENIYMVKQILPTKRLDNLEIELVSKDNQNITTGQQPCAFVLQIDILDSL